MKWFMYAASAERRGGCDVRPGAARPRRVDRHAGRECDIAVAALRVTPRRRRDRRLQVPAVRHRRGHQPHPGVRLAGGVHHRGVRRHRGRASARWSVAAASPTSGCRSSPRRSWRWDSNRCASACSASPTGLCTASARRRTRCSRSSPSASPSRTPPTTSCRGWRACSPREPVRSAPTCGCAARARGTRPRCGRATPRAPRPRRRQRHAAAASTAPAGSSRCATRATCSAR